MKKKIIHKVAALGLVATMAAGCSANTASSESTGTNVNVADGIVSVQVITDVYGDGQKVAAVAIEYSDEIDASSLDTSDYTISSVNVSEVDDYTITDIYTNVEAAMTDEEIGGNYVIVEVSTDYTLSGYGTSEEMSGGNGGPDSQEDSSDGDTDEERGERPENLDSSDSSEESEKQGGGRTMSFGTSSESNNLEVTVVQTGEISTTSGDAYVATDTEYTNDSSENINLLVDDFEQLTFTSEDGTELMYNLYLPEDYDSSKSYPIVLFMPDATGTSSDPYRTLTQGLGAVIWSSEESQAENEAIVLAPQYETGNESADITMELLESIVSEYSVDTDRIYLTGQSAGTIRAIEMMIENPDYFTGAVLVAGQADDAYTDRLAELADQNIWMIASTGDARALPGMTSIMEAVEEAGTEVTEGAWSATDSEEEQNAAAEEMIAAGTSINFTVLSDVVPEGISDSDATEHMNTWRVAYSISSIRNWLFDQTK